MSEEEYMECSVVAYPREIKFLHINGGAISYYVDRHVSDYVDRLQQENQELKKQLHEASIEMQEMIEQDIECPSNCEKLEKLQQENEKLKDNWNELKEYIVDEYYMYLPLEASTRSITILIDKMQEIEGSDSNE